jgi:UDPglucose 6-dehydrogenase
MKLSVFGTGYVGLVTGVCFAEMGNDVICADVDAKKISMLKSGKSPIYEPGIENLLAESLKGKRIEFTTDLDHAIHKSDVLFIAVGTPSAEDGSADMKYVYQVADFIGSKMTSYKLVVSKSTVPVGTQKKIKSVISEQLKKRGLSVEFDVVSNPEFLREGAAVEDCLNPNRVVVGCETEKAATAMKRLYEPFLKSGNPLLVMTPESSEMTKYAANSMLATKISFMNEMSRLCEKVGADIEEVRRGIGSDLRIGPHFIFAGVGYGGSCFPKDVRALIHAGSEFAEDLQILKAVEDVNQLQRDRFFTKILKVCGNSLKGKKIAQWGVAFKPGTDDIREAPAIDLITKFIEGGAQVMAFDPVAAPKAMEYFDHQPSLIFFEDQYEALEAADILVITTEWKSFREPNFEKMKQKMRSPLVCDGRNLYLTNDMKELGIEYHSIGR